MWIQIYREAGYEEAMRAVRLSRQSQDLSDTIGDNVGYDDMRLMLTLLRADDTTEGQPHSVGLRQIVFWIGASMPLYWWKHMDRYTVGKDQASDSTMYNIMNRPLVADDFVENVFDYTVDAINLMIDHNSFNVVIANLPSGYLQERSLMISLPTLRRIIAQRGRHKLPEWHFFVEQILEQARYPQLLK